MKTTAQQCRHRMPKGMGGRRVQVLLPDKVLKQFLLDARANLRSESAMAATIIIRHYQAALPDGATPEPSQGTP